MCLFFNQPQSFLVEHGNTIVSVAGVITGALLTYLFTSKLNRKQLTYSRNQSRIQLAYIPLATEIEKYREAKSNHILQNDGELDEIRHYYSEEFTNLVLAVLSSASAKSRVFFDKYDIEKVDKIASAVDENKRRLFSGFVELQSLYQMMHGLSIHDKSFTFDRLKHLMVDDQISAPIRMGYQDLDEFDTKIRQIYLSFIGLYELVNVEINSLYVNLITRIDKMSSP